MPVPLQGGSHNSLAGSAWGCQSWHQAEGDRDLQPDQAPQQYGHPAHLQGHHCANHVNDDHDLHGSAQAAEVAQLNEAKGFLSYALWGGEKKEMFPPMQSVVFERRAPSAGGFLELFCQRIINDYLTHGLKTLNVCPKMLFTSIHAFLNSAISCPAHL